MRNFDEDRRICEAATSGPWRLYGGKFGETNVHDAEGNVVACDVDWDRYVDARFIVEAREGWPAALAEIERLNNELAAWHQMNRTSSVIQRLAAENGRLRKLLTNIRNLRGTYPLHQYPYYPCDIADTAFTEKEARGNGE